MKNKKNAAVRAAARKAARRPAPRAPRGRRPILAEAACIADRANAGDKQNLTIAQMCDAIAALADVYWSTPDLFSEEFFGRHVPLARKRSALRGA